MPDNERKLRILHLTAGSDAGGLSRYIFDLCTAMHADGHSVAVAGERGAWHGLFENAPWPWIEVPLKGGPLAMLQAVRTLKRYLKGSPVDVLHAHYRRATLVGRRLQVNHQPHLLYTLHLSHVSLAWPRRWLTDFGDHTHVASLDAKQWLQDAAAMEPERISLIPHGIDVEKFPVVDDAVRMQARRTLGLPLDATVAAYVGRFDTPKNEEWLLDLAQRSQKALPRLHILLAGEGPNEAALRHRIEQDGLQNRVHLLLRPDPLQVYHAADALLLPSQREGFSLVCAEAMATGIPVLRTRTSGTHELIVEGVTGQSTAIDRNAFLETALSFLSDIPALRKMGAAAAEYVRRSFTIERQVEETVRLYHSLLDRKK